jgi:hypothetical protein
MPPAGTDVIAPVLQRHQQEVCCLEGPLVGGCGQHATVQVPSGQGHCETPGPWSDAVDARTSGPVMCSSARSVVPRTRASGLGHCDPSTGLVTGWACRSKSRAGLREKLRRRSEHYKRL